MVRGKKSAQYNKNYVKGSASMTQLNNISIGQTVQIVSLDLDSQVALRLQALGMILGTKVTVLQKKGKGTMIIDLRGTRFALGPTITEHIGVEVVAHD